MQLYFSHAISSFDVHPSISTRVHFRRQPYSARCPLPYGALMGMRLRPSHDRSWSVEQAILPHIVLENHLVHIHNVRDFVFRSSDDFTPGYRDHTYDLNRLERVWLVIAPFSRGWRGPAHSFLTFGFSDGHYLSISVEARREEGESFSIWKGALRQFELIFVIGEERDLIGLRAAIWDTPVYLYPMRATPDQVRRVFLHMVRRAQSLERQPEFYNTFTNNCSTNILDAVNAVALKPIPFGPRILVPGYSDAIAHKRDLIDTDLSLEAARTRFQVDERAKAAFGSADFSERIRE